MLCAANITVEQEVIVAAIMIAIFYIYTQGRRNSGRAGGGTVKELRAMEACKKQKIVTCASFCAATTLISKIIAEIIENHSEVGWCANSCNKFVSSRS